MDTFDCVMPTRVARNGSALTMDGRVNVRGAASALDTGPLEPGCDCYACASFSRGALRHWLKVGEILPLTLLTLHNIAFMMRLMSDMRAHLEAGTFSQFRLDFLARYAGGRYARESGTSGASA
jgi:queuine tRNA-ribosyltransferase